MENLKKSKTKIKKLKKKNQKIICWYVSCLTTRNMVIV